MRVLARDSNALRSERKGSYKGKEIIDAKMEAKLKRMVDELVPLVRQLVQADCRAHGEYGIALGGAHAKGVDDAESDLDLYLFAPRVLTVAERARACQAFSADVSEVVCWGEDEPFVQGGADFLYRGRKVECWLRNTEYIAGSVAECQAGVIHHDLVTWTVMGFYNYCALSDLAHMLPVDDPGGMLARWKDDVGHYPPKLRQAIIERYLGAARFWPHNFHYKSAVERCDSIYTVGIVQQVVHNLIQVLFAVNETYFPGDKKLDIALDHLAATPENFAQRVKWLLCPGSPLDRPMLAKQREELGRLLAEVEALIPAGLMATGAAGS